jgi:hypothetical protein
LPNGCRPADRGQLGQFGKLEGFRGAEQMNEAVHDKNDRERQSHARL